jgi:hypothetical protein
MDGKIEQHACIKFCVKLGKSTTDTPEVLRKAFGEHSLAGFEWHSLFKAGRMSDEDNGTFRATKNQQSDRKC